jgi:hypothetical protein
MWGTADMKFASNFNRFLVKSLQIHSNQSNAHDSTDFSCTLPVSTWQLLMVADVRLKHLPELAAPSSWARTAESLARGEHRDEVRPEVMHR